MANGINAIDTIGYDINASTYTMPKNKNPKILSPKNINALRYQCQKISMAKKQMPKHINDWKYN